MAQAIFVGMGESVQHFDLCMYTPSGTKARALAGKIGGVAVQELKELKEQDIYFLACKPQQFDDLAKQLRPLLRKDSLIISIMAAITCEQIEQALETRKIIRIMPNTPCLVGEGVCTFFASAEVEPAERELFQQVFSKFSLVVPFDQEEFLDTTTPICGSGPAFIFEMARLLTRELEKMNIDSALAKQMVAKTFAGSGKLLAQAKGEAEMLRVQVTSKKGMTEAALEVMENQKFDHMISEMIVKANERREHLKER